MPNPFPGMNPYLEQPEYWSDFHNQLVAALARALIPKLLPKYRVVTDKWVYKIAGSTKIAIGRPDVTVQQSRDASATIATAVAVSEPSVEPIKVAVPLREEVRQSYIEVKDVATKEVVTAIEVISPANKPGEGRQKYEAKRQQIFESMTHLVEIDLLRDGEPLPVSNSSNPSHYRILVSRSNTRPTADLYLFNLCDRIPSFQLPLLPGDTEPVVELQTLVDQLYDQLGYDYFIDYSSNPPLPWSEDDVGSWAGDRRENL
ncbi:DUF4058 family protein [Moorena producens]|uniref:DUF4058 family protein n=1 Tax=Moorena producens TaxID=1155739 RepID=UPI003C772B2F